MRILIVDDDAACRRMLEMYFSLTVHRDEHEVHLAADGAGVVERARDCQPDIILLDVVMPGVGGLEALEALKADGRTAAIPVVMISAMADEAEAALALGASGYMTKPLCLFGLIERLEGYVQETKRKSGTGPGLPKPQSEKGASNAETNYITGRAGSQDRRLDRPVPKQRSLSAQQGKDR